MWLVGQCSWWGTFGIHFATIVSPSQKQLFPLGKRSFFSVSNSRRLMFPNHLSSQFASTPSDYRTELPALPCQSSPARSKQV